MSKHSEVSYRDVWNGIEEADNKKRRMENSGTIDLNDSQDFKISKDEKKSQVRSFIKGFYLNNNRLYNGIPFQHYAYGLKESVKIQKISTERRFPTRALKQAPFYWFYSNLIK